MNGETDLNALLKNMKPILHAEEMVFCSVQDEEGDFSLLRPIGIFREEEGVTLILRRSQASAAGLAFTYPCRMITLTVHSSLQAVGFLARISQVMAAHGISTNIISAYYHDHLFVPPDRVEEALGILQSLQELPGPETEQARINST